MSVKTGRESAITGLQEYRSEIQGRINRLKQDLSKVDEMIVMLGGNSTQIGEVREATDAARVTENDSSGPQEIVEDFVRRNPESFLRPSQIGREILREGYRPGNLKVWPNQVNTCLQRAIAKGIVETRIVDGRKVYGLKEQSLAK